ncbi:hypothetical protein N9R41_00305 [bacterium]|nr:hypothetical protein [bacterium]
MIKKHSKFNILIIFWCEADFDLHSKILEPLINSGEYTFHVLDNSNFWFGEVSSDKKFKLWYEKHNIPVLKIPEKIYIYSKIYKKIERIGHQIPLVSPRRLSQVLYKLSKKLHSFTFNKKYLSDDNIFILSHYHPSLVQIYLENKYTNYLNICLPHHPGFSQARDYIETLPKYNIAAWLQTSTLSDNSYRIYRNNTFVIGFPRDQKKWASKNKIMNGNTIVLILQKRWGSTGFKSDEARKLIQEIINRCNETNTKLLVKCHPKSLKEIDETLSKLNPSDFEYIFDIQNISDDVFCCISFPSTAGLYLACNGIPVFLIRPKKVCKKNISILYSPMYYNNDTNLWTDVYLDQKIFEPYDSIDKFSETLIDRNSLFKLRERQSVQLEKNFPKDASEKLHKVLKVLEAEYGKR